MYIEVENNNFKILSDSTIEWDRMTEARRPDIVILDYGKKGTMIIDVAVPGDTRKTMW